MPKIQGLWRPHAKIDEAEFESAKTRTAARLADLFGVDAPAATGGGPQAGPGDGAAEPGGSANADDTFESGMAVAPPETGGKRPPIVVEAGPGLVGVMAEPDRAAPDLVGVMAGTGETIAAAPPSDAVMPADADSTGDPGAGSDTGAGGRPVAGAGRSRRRKTPADPAETGRASARAQRTHPRATGAGRPVSTRSAAGRKAAPALATATCPYCAVLLQPAPVSSQRCARCHQRIIVKRADGSPVPDG